MQQSKLKELRPSLETLLLAAAFVLLCLFAYLVYWQVVEARGVAPTYVTSSVADTEQCQAYGALDYHCTQSLTLRFEVPSDMESSPHAALLSYFRGEVRFKVNGVSLPTLPTFETEFVPRGAPPVIVLIPPETIKAGMNQLTINFMSRSLMGIEFGKQWVGEAKAISQHYRLRVFYSWSTRYVADGMILSLLCFALVAGFLVKGRRTIYFLFSGIALSFLASGLVYVMPMPMTQAQSIYLNFSWIIGALLVFPFFEAIRTFPLRQSRIWPWTIFLAFVITVALWTLNDIYLLRRILVSVLILSALLAIYSLFRLMQDSVKQRTPDLLLFGGAFAGILALTIVKLFFYYQPDKDELFYQTGPYTLSVILLGLVLMRWFLVDFIEVSNHHQELIDVAARAVDAEREQLELNQLQKSQLIRQSERTRIMADLHDGVAGKLVSILNLARIDRGGDKVRDIEHVSQAAMQELRFVVNSTQSFGVDLSTCLTIFRQQMTPFVEGLGFRLIWSGSFDGAYKEISPEESLGIFRILQEAVQNAVKHSGGSQIEVTVSNESNDTLAIHLSDNGLSAQSPYVEGFGITNMRFRAKQIGAQLEVRLDNIPQVSLRLRL